MKKPIRVVRMRKVAKAKADVAAGVFDHPTRRMVDKTVKGILRDLKGE